MGGGTKGGGSSGSQTTTTQPWSGAQPYLTEALRGVQRAYRDPPEFFGGQTYVGPNEAELGSWDRRLGYTDQVFGGSSGPRYGDLTDATSRLLQGGGASDMADQLGSAATSGLLQGFSGPGQLGRYNFDPNLDPSRFTPNLGGPDSLQQRSVDPRLDLASFTPTFGQAGGLDARDAYSRMLAGQPDYAGAQGAIDAANQPLLRSFQQDVLPQIAGRAGISGHDTGAIKTLNRVLPELGERMSTNALNVMEGERQRALGAQERAAGAVSSGGFQGYGLGLQGAGQQFGQNMGAQQYGTQQDLARAGLNEGLRGQQLQAYGLGLQGAGQQLGANQALAQFGLQQDLGQAGLTGDYRNQLLGFGNLAGSLQGQQSQDIYRGASLFPSTYSMGFDPANTLAGYGGFQRGFDESALNEQMARHDFAQNQPMNMAQWYANLAGGMGGLGSTQQMDSRSRQSAGGIGGSGVSGGDLASLAMAAFMFSDRRLKTDVVRIGALPSGIPLYRYRLHGSNVEQIGVLADEVSRIIPAAVHRHRSGYDMVDYARLR